MDYTLLRNHCERSRLLHITSKHVSEPSSTGSTKESDPAHEVSSILFPTGKQETAAASKPITDNRFNSLGEALDGDVYDKLVKCLQAEGINVCHRRDVRSKPKPGEVSSVSRFVVTQRGLSLRSRRYTAGAHLPEMRPSSIAPQRW